MATDPAFQALCLDTLAAGAVQSFVDVVYLACDGASGSQLAQARDLLMRAETARRRGDTGMVIGTYGALAQLFAGEGRRRTSIYFLERSLDIARLVGDGRAEMEACRALGEAHEACGDAARAVSYHEAHKKLASGLEDGGAAATAASHLVHVFFKQAEAAEAKGDLRLALDKYMSAVEAAASCGDAATMAETSYHAGRLYVLLGEAHMGVPLLQEHLRIIQATPTLAALEYKALAALAAAHMAGGTWDPARECLESIVIAGAAAGPTLTEALEGLGVVHAKSGNVAEALASLTRALELRGTELAAGEGSRACHDRLRLAIGMIRAEAGLSDHLAALLQPTTARLLQWKASAPA